MELLVITTSIAYINSIKYSRLEYIMSYRVVTQSIARLGDSQSMEICDVGRPQSSDSQD